MFLAILFIVLGAFALLNALGIIVGTNFWSLIWAVLLLSIGLRLLTRHGKCPFCGWKRFKMNNDCCDCDCDHETEQPNKSN